MTLGSDRGPSRMALVLAIAFTAAVSVSAVAGAGGTTGTVTKKQAKRIAKKVVRKQAPKLSVKNAANLDGQAPSTYRDRVAQATSGADATVSVPGTSATEILGPVDIDVPAGVGFVRVDGGASFEADPTLGLRALWFQQDGACAKSGFGWENHSYSDTDFQQTTVHLVVPVTPGTHSFRLCASANFAAEARARTLLVETVARGPGG